MSTAGKKRKRIKAAWRRKRKRSKAAWRRKRSKAAWLKGKEAKQRKR